MKAQPRRARRCQLSVPGSDEKMMRRAAGLHVDHVFLDLEDSVAPDEKRVARSRVVKAIRELEWRPRTLCVRINDVTTEWCHDDIIEVVTGAGGRIDTLMLTKAKSPGDVEFLHKMLDQLEAKLKLSKRIGIECLIEEVEGMMRVEAIAGCSDRLEALIFGMADYSASQHMHLEEPVGELSDLWDYPRYKLTIACRAKGLDPVDGPYLRLRDLDGFEREAKRCNVLGMVGKWAIHPSQIEVAQRIFAPSVAAVEMARRQKDAYEKALADGTGAIAVDGVMVDAATIRSVQNIIDLADLIEA